ncbi:MAG: DUF5107 domain-containing protein, partial [Armatimonadota bacterium]|nr:DUF5107 domain-containing protein [Armatimonadota bacterium]
MDAENRPVRVYRTELILPTYPLGPPDPNPPFPDGRRVDIYPYPMLDDLGEARAEQAYLAVVLENEYLRLTVLPQLGGHLYSAFDKSAGREIFYRNNVVKPGLVALRGAWISGGVEFNFPIGHSVTTVSPVDWHVVEGEDAATIWIGDLERVSRMHWWVGITLRAGIAAIETEIVLYNRTPLRRRYYFWSNAAVRATPGLQFICPMDYRKVGSHIGPYPVEDGKDLSWYRNHDHAVDVFAHQVREDWFGCYHHDEDAGVVHVANAPECLGKKLFTWGTADAGLIWAHILSDGDGPYCEIQAGRFEDQSTWRFIQPHSVERWREWWYPVGGAGPFVKANRYAALALRRKDDALQLGVYATRILDGLTLEARVDGGAPQRWRVSAAPGSPFVAGMPAPPGAEGTVRLTLRDPAGKVWLEYQPRPTPPPPPPTPPPPDTAETRWLSGIAAEQAYRMEEAEAHY